MFATTPGHSVRFRSRVAVQAQRTPSTSALPLRRPAVTRPSRFLPALAQSVARTAPIRQETALFAATFEGPAREFLNRARWFDSGRGHSDAALLGTAGEVAAICGIDASGCNGSDTSDIVSIGDASSGVRPEAVIAQEYVHYITAHRDNAPWKAIDWARSAGRPCSTSAPA
jgi:hypothetical protein